MLIFYGISIVIFGCIYDCVNKIRNIMKKVLFVVIMILVLVSIFVFVGIEKVVKVVKEEKKIMVFMVVWKLKICI